MAGRGDLPRFRVAPGDLGADSVTLQDGEARHVRVMRLRAGDRLRLFDGAGTEVRAELLEVGEERVVARPLERVEADTESPCRVVLAQAVPVKLNRFDDVVRLATELGVAGITPVLSARGETPGGGPEVVVRRAERWRRIVTAAAKQCGRSVVPEVADPVAFRELDWARLPEPRLFLDPGGGGLLGALSSEERPAAATLLVGPEGGWTDDEAAVAADHGALGIGAGPRILRSDSAGAAILAIVQHVWGDLR